MNEKLLKANGLTAEDFAQQPTEQDIAEAAYLMAEYNAILIEIMMEE